jgi:hypothetical protein
MLDRYYFEQSARFFMLLLLVQAWIVGLDVVFANVNFATYLTVGTGILFIVLLISKSYRVHVAGVIIIGLAFVLRTIMQAL